MKKVGSNTQITVKLNEAIKDPRFYIKDGSNSTLVSSTGANPYILTVPELDVGKEYSLEVTDLNKTFELSKAFTYRSLVKPVSANIAQTNSNKAGEINASNVNNATIVVSLTSNNKPINSTPGTLEVALTDTPAAGQTAKKLTFTHELIGNDTEAKIENVDLSSLNDGTLTLEALVKDDQGNVSDVYSIKTIIKKSNLPIVRYTTVTRNEISKAQISLVKTTNNDVLYYLVKETGETAPTVDEVIAGNKKDTTNNVNVILNADIENGNAEKSYVAYIASTSSTGTKSADVLAVKVAKLDATSIKSATDLIKKTGTEATFTWNYDESTEGFVEYKVALYNGNNFVTEKIIKKGETREINFFDDMKKASGTYSVKVTAVADNVDHINSTELTNTSANVTVSALTAPTNLAFDTTTKTLLKWNMTKDVEFVNNYTVQMAKYNTETKTYEVIETASTSSTSYDIASMVEKYGIGSYEFKVTANAKSDILKVNNTTAPGVKYALAEAIKDLAVIDVKDTEIKLDGSFLPNVFASDMQPTYTLYMKAGENGKYAENSITTDPTNASGVITELPLVVKSLTANSTYYFKVVTKVNNIEYVSNEISVTTKMTPISTSELTYKKYEPTSAAEAMAKLTDANGITYNEETGILYIKNNSNDVVAYSSENEKVANIISVLKQMTLDTDKIQITNNEITKLVLTSSSTKATVYDLSKVSSKADVEITGNATHLTTVVGTVQNITLKGTSSKFDLSNLTVSDKVTISDDNYDVLVGKNTVLSFVNSKTKAIVNKVSFEQVTKLQDIRVTENGFKITGSENKLTLDASNAKSEINLEFVGAIQKGLEITSNNEYGVKLLTNTIEISQLLVKSGKIDVTEATYSSIVLGGVNTKANSVTLVTNYKAPDTKNDDKIVMSGTIYEWMNGYMMQATQDEVASYSTTEGSGIIKFNFKAVTEGKAEVMIHKVFKEESLEKSKELDVQTKEEKITDQHLKNYMKYVKVESVDKKTNTITVKANIEKIPPKTIDGEEHKYYALVIDTGIERDNLLSGSRYNIIDGGEKKLSGDLELGSTEILVYLYADKPTMIVSFIDSTTGEEHFYTIKVVNDANLGNDD